MDQSTLDVLTNRPYHVGKTLLLHATSTPSAPGTTISAKVRHVYEPFTLSCVLRTDSMLEDESDAPVIVKLYDCRFSYALRDEYNAKPYTDAVDQSLQDYMKSGAGTKFVDELRYAKQERRELDDMDWTDAQNELFLNEWCRDMYLTEIATYEALGELQGSSIPKLLGTVRLPWNRTPGNSSYTQDDGTEVLGIVLEFVAGFDLSRLSECAPRAAWQGICDEAIRVIHSCSDRSVINKDVRPENYVVAPLKPRRSESHWKLNDAEDAMPGCGAKGLDESSAYRVIMIDFAQCRLRSGEPQEIWGRRKWNQDEEGAIGMVMKHRLKQAASFDLIYNPSLKYLQWAPGEED